MLLRSTTNDENGGGTRREAGAGTTEAPERYRSGALMRDYTLNDGSR
jgi:hypothetical protein